MITIVVIDVNFFLFIILGLVLINIRCLKNYVNFILLAHPLLKKSETVSTKLITKIIEDFSSNCVIRLSR